MLRRELRSQHFGKLYQRLATECTRRTENYIKPWIHNGILNLLEFFTPAMFFPKLHEIPRILGGGAQVGEEQLKGCLKTLPATGSSPAKALLRSLGVNDAP